MEQSFQFVAYGLGQGHQTRCRVPAPRPRSADMDRQRAAADRRPEAQELAALEVADALRLPAVHSQEIGSALHVDIEKSPPHQKVRRLGGDVLGQLGEPLGGDYARKPALAPAAHEIGHGRKRQASRFLGHLARRLGGEHLCLVHHHQRGIPVFARGIEQRGEKQRRAAYLQEAASLSQRFASIFT